jgi:DNA transformation protein
MNDPGFVDHCLELLAPLGPVRAKRMFGGHGLYIDDVFMALIAGDRLYLKVDADTRERFVDAGCEPFVYDSKRQSIAMSYWSAPPEATESPALMQPWARLAMQAALRAAALKRTPARRPGGRTAAGDASASTKRRSPAR